MIRPTSEKGSTLTVVRLILAAIILLVAELAWDLSDWLQGLSRRVERRPWRTPRGVVRIGVLAVVSGVGLVAAAAPAFRGTVERPGIEVGPAPLLGERPADVVEAFTRVCAAAGRAPLLGMEGRVFVVRCPKPPENLGVMPVAKVAR